MTRDGIDFREMDQHEFDHLDDKAPRERDWAEIQALLRAGKPVRIGIPEGEDREALIKEARDKLSGGARLDIRYGTDYFAVQTKT